MTRSTFEEVNREDPEYVRAGLIVINATYHAIICQAITALEKGRTERLAEILADARPLVAHQQQALLCADLAIRFVDDLLTLPVHTPEARAHLERLRQTYVECQQVIQLRHGKRGGHA